jgi:hypothetical protein
LIVMARDSSGGRVSSDYPGQARDEHGHWLGVTRLDNRVDPDAVYRILHPRPTALRHLWTDGECA